MSIFSNRIFLQMKKRDMWFLKIPYESRQFPKSEAIL
jgi:hypothetical protein